MDDTMDDTMDDKRHVVEIGDWRREMREQRALDGFAAGGVVGGGARRSGAGDRAEWARARVWTLAPKQKQKKENRAEQGPC
jgi:hypothetical protein